VSRLYERIMHKNGHQEAMGAVGRHLAEATLWMPKKGEPYTRIRRSANRPGKRGSERGQRLVLGGPISDCEAPAGEPYAAETAPKGPDTRDTRGKERRQQGLTRRALSEMLGIPS